MKTAISDDDVRLLKVAQRNYNDAKRQLAASENCVARVLKISKPVALGLLETSAIQRELAECGVEIYQAAECRSPWPDSTTLGVWAFMGGGVFFATWLAGVI